MTNIIGIIILITNNIVGMVNASPPYNNKGGTNN